jgi:hypothetical protein
MLLSIDQFNLCIEGACAKAIAGVATANTGMAFRKLEMLVSVLRRDAQRFPRQR